MRPNGTCRPSVRRLDSAGEAHLDLASLAEARCTPSVRRLDSAGEAHLDLASLAEARCTPHKNARVDHSTRAFRLTDDRA